MMRTACLGLLLVVSCCIFSGCSPRSDKYHIGSDSRGFQEMTDDAGVTYDINREYLKDDLIHTVHIDVDTHRGVVTLHGSVDHQEEATRAINIALDHEKVIKVISNLVLRNETLSPRGVVYQKIPPVN